MGFAAAQPILRTASGWMLNERSTARPSFHRKLQPALRQASPTKSLGERRRMATADTPYHWSNVFDEHTRILDVDDDPILREFASVYLTSPVSEVEAAPDAEAALDLLSHNEFDVVLVDIGLPGMDGFELVQRMRAQERL